MSAKISRSRYALGLSIRVLAIITIVIVAFGVYLGILIYGENSLTVLSQLKQSERNLLREAKRLKSENQRLQKESFELKQLATWEE
ncbi:hypothetical protein MNB_SV-6-731 [hydrothermal vent metagenome]|uniref:Uncharacterized protein n=1 Tax=hydrothermal vent metagenome TaxID=652676 RepID=A0A1W1BMS8_9ZZZZ